MKVFAGDKNLNGVHFYPAADASYKNLIWENLPAPDILFHMSMYTPAIVSLDIIYYVIHNIRIIQIFEYFVPNSCIHIRTIFRNRILFEYL